MYIARQRHLPRALLELAPIGGGGPGIAVRVAKAQLHLRELYLALVRQLPDGGGVQRIQRQAIGAGLDESGVLRRVAFVPLIPLHGRRRGSHALLPGEEERGDDDRDDGQDGEEAVHHVTAAACRRASSR